jgi:hypothetical protein
MIQALFGLLGIFLGVIGWFFTKLMFEPTKELFDLRRETQECLIIHGNVGKDAPAEERRAASDAFRRLGAGFVSRHVAAYPWVRWCWTRWPGWDIHSAGELLISLGNTTQFEGYSMAGISPVVGFIRNSLKLPAPARSPVLQDLFAHARQPSVASDSPFD